MTARYECLASGDAAAFGSPPGPSLPAPSAQRFEARPSEQRVIGTYAVQLSDVEPAWIISALGVISGATFGLFGFLRGRRMERRLNDTFALLAQQVQQHPEEAVRRFEARVVAAPTTTPETGLTGAQLQQRIETYGQELQQMPDRSAAMVQLWSEGAEPQQIGDLFGVPESEVEEALEPAKSLGSQLAGFYSDDPNAGHWPDLSDT